MLYYLQYTSFDISHSKGVQELTSFVCTVHFVLNHHVNILFEHLCAVLGFLLYDRISQSSVKKNIRFFLIV